MHILNKILCLHRHFYQIITKIIDANKKLYIQNKLDEDIDNNSNNNNYKRKSKINY